MDKRQRLIDYASSLTSIKREGNKLVGCCPIHQEKTPSFKIEDGKDRAVCYGCGFFGDVFDLYQEINNSTFLEAKRALGFWDENFKPPEKPNNEYSDDRKKELYLKCREALVNGKNYWVFKDGKRLRAEQFVWWCMKDNPDRMLYIYQICLNSPSENNCYLLYKFFLEQIHLEEKGYWDAIHPKEE